MDRRTDGKSPHSTGLCALPRPLPKIKWTDGQTDGQTDGRTDGRKKKKKKKKKERAKKIKENKRASLCRSTIL